MQRRNWIVATLLVGACGRDMTETTRPAPAAPALSRSASAAVDRVYTLSNATTGNAVLSFPRYVDGTLGAPTSFATTGLGTGAGLGSEGAVMLSASGSVLIAVDAGSSQITSFRVTHDGLTRVATLWSGGTLPISVTMHERLLYVLNAGGHGNISGFLVAQDGQLSPIAGSTRSLGGSAVGPAQVGFTPDGHALVVTEKAANAIATFVVDHSGLPGAPLINASAGQTPFGFTFDQRGRLIVTEAFGGAPNASAASSYRIGADGALTTLSASVPTNQTAACWFALSINGRFAFATNTGSGSVSGYAIHDGRLALLDADGRTGIAGASPTDDAVTANGQFLYALNSGDKSISAFEVNNGTGALTSVATTSGLPAGSVGLAAQ